MCAELTSETIGLRQTFVDLDEASSSSTPDSPLRKARVMLDELIESLDSLSQEFGILALGSYPSFCLPLVAFHI